MVCMTHIDQTLDQSPKLPKQKSMWKTSSDHGHTLEIGDFNLPNRHLVSSLVPWVIGVTAMPCILTVGSRLDRVASVKEPKTKMMIRQLAELQR